MTAKTVAVIGAGASGLIAARVLLKDSFNVTIFDREKHLGGIWSPDRAYVDLHTQTVAGFMEYSELPDTEPQAYAPWQHIHHYLQKYADKFHITERIRFQTKLVLINKDDLENPNLPWIVKIESADGQHETFEFDFVVVAIHIGRSRFVFSPPGVGVDCYRTWEALYLGSTPIVLSSPINSIFQNLPVLIVNNYEEISLELLKAVYNNITKEKYDYRRLYKGYWQREFHHYRNSSEIIQMHYTSSKQ